MEKEAFLRDSCRVRCRPTEPADHFLKWGNTKRLRCVKANGKEDTVGNHHHHIETTSTATTVRARAVDRRVTSNSVATTISGKETPLPASHRVLRNSEASPSIGLRSLHHNFHSSSQPENGERQNQHPSKVAAGGRNGETTVNEKNMMINDIQLRPNTSNGSNGNDSQQSLVWPKFIIGLSSKEKEEDFLAIKGSRLPQRPKKRSKLVQRTLNMISPGSWLCELSQERYEVKEKKTSKKRPRGLKEMAGSMNSDSD